MKRSYPRFLLSKSTQTKSKGIFIIHTLEPAFIAVPTFNQIRQIEYVDVIKVWPEGFKYLDEARVIAKQEIPKWWRYSGIHDSYDPIDKIITQLQKLDFLRTGPSPHYTIDQAQEVIRIIFPRKTDNFFHDRTSYGLKHDLEAISQLFNDKDLYKYCGNDVLKQALINEGFKIKESFPGSPNVIVNISQHDVHMIESLAYYRVNNFNKTESY